MTAKEYLSQAKRLKDIIDCKLQELEYWKSLASNITAGFEERYNPNSAHEASFVKSVEKIVSIQESTADSIKQLVDLWNDINICIDSMASHEEQILLRYRYLSDLSWDDIEKKMNISSSTSDRIHRSALNNFRVPM